MHYSACLLFKPGFCVCHATVSGAGGGGVVRAPQRVVRKVRQRDVLSTETLQKGSLSEDYHSEYQAATTLQKEILLSKLSS